MRSTTDEFGSTFLTFIIAALAVIVALILSWVALIAIPAYFGYRLYSESPKRLERLAREETQVLYDHARAGRVRLSEFEIEAALSKHWPPDTPHALKIQLFEIGKALFAAEGLSPEVPPMPALCNTVEGARYRDMLARLSQARSDRTMVLSALDVIAQSLAEVAHAVPLTNGDTLVEVTQFLHPMGQAIQNIIAPFFQENDYQHFKELREQLDANLYATYRVNPIFPTDY